VTGELKMEDKCPRDMQIGRHEARIGSLESEMTDIRKQVQSNAVHMIEDKASRSGFLKGIHFMATFIGYAVIIAILLAGEKFSGAIEAVLKFLTSFKV
jgi:hypothetical protein